ncbi:DUF4870 family protein [Crenothrix sp.]|uniref:DUF4870 family protein n=1 Tax=Crenothrix sp. TaxID=3100433 RepID=UPI00374CE7FF
MNNLAINDKHTDSLEKLKRLTTVIYFCQALTFALAGLPLLVGAVLNFLNREAVEGTWLQSHFDWQIKTVWLTLGGFALSGLTFTMGIGLFILIPTLVILIYRIFVGWTALTVDKPISDRD